MNVSKKTDALALLDILHKALDVPPPECPIAAARLRKMLQAIRTASRVAVHRGGDISIETPGFLGAVFWFYRQRVWLSDSLDREIFPDHQAVFVL